MIKKLQRKFIMITMSSLLLVMLLLIGSINGINLYKMNQDINSFLQVLSENQGEFPKFNKNGHPKDILPLPNDKLNEETPFQIRYFSVKLSNEGNVEQINTGHIAAVSSSDARDYAKEVIAGGKESGYTGIYKYQVVQDEEDYLVVFVDCREKLQNATQILAISCAVALGTLVLVFILISILSKRAMKPFIESAEKQKLFITDAGHEIKTPLAIISANADVLELLGGDNEWITSIRNQTARLDKLVKNLLILSKMDEGNIKLAYTEFDLSDLITRMASSFAAIAETKNKKFELDIQPELRITGDINSIEQLVSTLVDNAVKYSDEEGTVRITLKAGKKGKKLQVYNTVENLDVANLDKLFDRFYRSDASRSRETGGYGIGLSIAKSIVEAHQGKISVKSEDGKSICFTVVL